MLHTLTIQQIRLVKELTVDFSSGLTVVSGETGSGKSVLLEALGLALGGRADVGQIRKGVSQASVTLVFFPDASHGVWAVLREQGLGLFFSAEEPLILRRVLSRDGPLSRAFINEQAVGVSFLKRVAETLVDIHGQFDRWLSPLGQMALVDGYGGLLSLQKDVEKSYHVWLNAAETLKKFQQNIAEAKEKKSFLLHSLEEIEPLNPQVDEEACLLDQRHRLLHCEKIIQGLQGAAVHLNDAVEPALAAASRLIEKISPFLGGDGENLSVAFHRAFAEIGELIQIVNELTGKNQESGGSLEALDDRLFQLRSLARKHGVGVEDLVSLQERLRQQLGNLEMADAHEDSLKSAVEKAWQNYSNHAVVLHHKRQQTAGLLEKKVSDELSALKLEQARFVIHLFLLDEKKYGPRGMDAIEFQVATNAGDVPAALHQVASGGELSRFLLALKVVFSTFSGVSVLIFDEIDTGTGGAVAQAIGMRLKGLSDGLQVIAVTHSPQVTVQADSHFLVVKKTQEEVFLSIKLLAFDQHIEEVARMLSGDQVTDQARAAALQLKKTSFVEKKFQKTRKKEIFS